jgi:hypothetical protein
LRAVSSWDQLPYSDTQTLWWYRYIAEFIPGFSLPFDKNLQKVEQMVDKWFGDGKHVSLQELSEIVAVFGKVATTNTVRVKRSLDNFLGRTPPGPPPYIELGEQYFTTSGGSKGRQSVIFHELTHYSGGTWDYGYVDRPFKKQPTYTAGPHWPEPENPDPNMLYKPVHLDPPRLRKNADAYTGFVQDMEYFY